MKLKNFIKLLEEYQSIDKSVDKLNEALKEFDPDFNYLVFSRYKELFLDTIKDAMNDRGEWIGYFLFEQDCKFTKKHIISDENGKNLPFRNYNDLYNLITLHK